jgi:hypothetical protein
MSVSESSDSPAIELDRYLHRMRTAGRLADELDVSPNFIQAMKRQGFKTPGGKASVAMARKFLAECPEFGVRESIGKHSTP